MNVFLFWMWNLQPWMYPMYATFWWTSSKTCMSPLPMYNLLWWLETLLYFAHFVIGRGQLVISMAACTEQIPFNDGFNAILALFSYAWFALLYFLWLLFAWLWIGSWFPQSLMCADDPSYWIVCSKDQHDYDSHVALSSSSLIWLVLLMFRHSTCWVGSPLCDISLSFLTLRLFSFTEIRCSILLTLGWWWWQVLCAPLFYYQPLPQRLTSLNFMDQHGVMLRTHLCMHSQPLFRGWIIRYVMIIFTMFSECNAGCSVPWASPYPLLSPLSSCLYAQKHITLAICFCWHPAWPMTSGDEVKGKASIVYEEPDSETKSTLCRTLSWPPFCWWSISNLQQFSCTSDCRTDRCFSFIAFVLVKKHSSIVLDAILAALYLCLRLNIQVFVNYICIPSPLFQWVLKAFLALCISYGHCYYGSSDSTP